MSSYFCIKKSYAIKSLMLFVILAFSLIVNAIYVILINFFSSYFQDCLRSCQEQIEQTLALNLSNMAQTIETTNKMEHSSTHHSEHTHVHEHLKEQPTTPTDVQDIHFWPWIKCRDLAKKIIQMNNFLFSPQKDRLWHLIKILAERQYGCSHTVSLLGS